MSSLLQQRCAHRDCRFAAAPPAAYCSHHQQLTVLEVPARTSARSSGQRDEFSVSVMLRQDLDQLTGETLDRVALELGAISNMTREIGILRLLLERTLTDGLAEGDAKALAKAILPLVGEIGRSLRTNEQIKDGNRDIIAEAMKKTLIEYGKRQKR